MNFSIIICAYNPDPRLLRRCLDSLLVLSLKEVSAEVIIVDNNSLVPIKKNDFIADYSQLQINFVEESRPGLAYARAKGIKEAKYDWILFFDDDNEPEHDYLVELKNLCFLYPQVGAWGPGNIHVDFVDGGYVKEDESYFRNVFQEKSYRFVEYACVREWLSVYPFGTGLAIRKDSAMVYADKVNTGELSLTGRLRGRMTSGDDVQMVLIAINSGFAAGVSPSLRLNHLIPSTKLSYEYLKKVTFGTTSCYHIAVSEVIDEHRSSLSEMEVPSNLRLLKKIIMKELRYNSEKKIEKKLAYIEYLGAIYGLFWAKGMLVPEVLEKAIKRLGIES